MCSLSSGCPLVDSQCSAGVCPAVIHKDVHQISVASVMEKYICHFNPSTENEPLQLIPSYFYLMYSHHD